MHLQAIVGAISLLIVSVLSDSLPISSDIFYWPVGAPQPSVLARVAYDPATLTSNVISYNTPKTGSDSTDNLIRIGFYTSTPSNSKQWVGSLVSLSALTDKNQPTLRLHLGPANEVYHVDLAASDKGHSGVELVLSQPGAQPHLNRPVVVRPDGGEADVVEEKTFFQKYWWVLLIIGFLSLGGSGEGQ
ncbi:uncharacterized protein N7469_008811 [Penicillium citrinum]|uniref:Uncharacterized protein n=2 Tax=Penicillium TaxID=5073 RepID=A0A9W9NM63_PENCI|nr:uncharacterized protein N7469_008811 [Penicillium citrinum]KAJ5222571.1 hypothetical protein N7469_008811 [Penicillium citrinum]KAJ5580727.1 hypothetical protein N7450_007028 [Penicillium hetheringtonii]